MVGILDYIIKNKNGIEPLLYLSISLNLNNEILSVGTSFSRLLKSERDEGSQKLPAEEYLYKDYHLYNGDETIVYTYSTVFPACGSVLLFRPEMAASRPAKRERLMLH